MVSFLAAFVFVAFSVGLSSQQSTSVSSSLTKSASWTQSASLTQSTSPSVSKSATRPGLFSSSVSASRPPSSSLAPLSSPSSSVSISASSAVSPSVSQTSGLSPSVSASVSSGAGAFTSSVSASRAPSSSPSSSFGASMSASRSGSVSRSASRVGAISPSGSASRASSSLSSSPSSSSVSQVGSLSSSVSQTRGLSLSKSGSASSSLSSSPSEELSPSASVSVSASGGVALGSSPASASPSLSLSSSMMDSPSKSPSLSTMASRSPSTLPPVPSISATASLSSSTTPTPTSSASTKSQVSPTASPQLYLDPALRQLSHLPLPYCPTVDDAVVTTILPGCSAQLEAQMNSTSVRGEINETVALSAVAWCACEPGAFPDLAAGGACHACPPAAQGFAVALPILRLTVFVLVGGVALACVTASALFAIGAPVLSGVSRTLQLAAYILAMLQVIAQTGSSVGPCLPDFLRDALAVVAPLVLDSSVFAPAACAVVASSGSSMWLDLFPSQMATFFFADVLAAVLLICDAVARTIRSLQMPSSRAVALCTSTGKLAGLALLMITPIALRTAVGLLDCPSVALPSQVAAALQAWDGEDSVHAVPETAQITLQLLRSQPYIICYGNTHGAVAAAAATTILIFLLLLPAAMCASLYVARRRAFGVSPHMWGPAGCSACKSRRARARRSAPALDESAQVRERLMTLHATARSVDVMAQEAWVRGAAQRASLPQCLCCPSMTRGCRRMRVVACGAGRGALAEVQVLPPPPPAPCSLASLLARHFPAMHRALFSPPALPPVTSLSVEDLALRPYLLVATPALPSAALGRKLMFSGSSSRRVIRVIGSDAATTGRRLAQDLADITPIVRLHSNSHIQTSIENLLFAGDYRPSLAALAIADSSAMAFIIVIAAALPVASPNATLAGLRAGLTIAICLALGWTLLEHKPFVGADVSKLALRELTLVVYGGCATLALFCSSCSPDPRGLLAVSIATLVAILLVPIAACGALVLTAQRVVEAPKMHLFGGNGASTRFSVNAAHHSGNLQPNTMVSARRITTPVPETRNPMKRVDSSLIIDEPSHEAFSPRTVAAAGAVSAVRDASSRRLFSTSTIARPGAVRSTRHQ